MTGRTKERTVQSKRARPGLLALIDYQVAPSGANLYSPDVEFADVLTSFSGVTFFFLLRFRRYAFIEAAALCSIAFRCAGPPIATLVSSFFHFCLFGDVAFTEYLFWYHCRFLCVWRVHVVRSFLPDGDFLPCDHGLGF